MDMTGALPLVKYDNVFADGFINSIFISCYFLKSTLFPRINQLCCHIALKCLEARQEEFLAREGENHQAWPLSHGSWRAPAASQALTSLSSDEFPLLDIRYRRGFLL